MALCSLTKAQDYRFSQFYNAPLVLNPAMAGIQDADYRLNVSYNTQWQSISNAYKTSSGSFDMPMFGDVAGMSKMGMGLSYLSDKAGTTNYGFTSINYAIAYHLKTTRFAQLSAGLMLGYGQSNVNLSNVKWEDQHNGNNYDPSAASGESVFVEQVRYFDAGLGGIWTYYDPDYDRKFEIGISGMHLNFPNHSFKAQYQDRLKPKIQLHAGMDMGFANFILKPKIQVMNQGPSYFVNVGSLASFRLGDQPDSRFTNAYVASSFDIGMFYRFRESLMITAQYEHKKHLLVGLSYDFILSDLSSVSRSGGFEIALRYQGQFKNQKINVKKDMYKKEKDREKKKPAKNKTNIRM